MSNYILLFLLYAIIIIFLSQTLVYNVTLANPIDSLFSFCWLFFLVYNIILILVHSKRTDSFISLRDYVALLKKILVVSLLSLLVVVILDLVVMNELNVPVYVKFWFTLFFISLFVSLVYFLEISFYKYRILWLIGFVGTIILAPLLEEAGAFVRDLRFKSLLDYWNWIVPYKSIEYLRQFILLEGWQGWEIAMISVVLLIVYWFIVVTICLYVRQLQLSWKFSEITR